MQLDLVLLNLRFGSLIFDEKGLKARRTIDGLVLTLPMAVHTDGPDDWVRGGLAPLISDIEARGRLCGVEVGRARDASVYRTWHSRTDGELELAIDAEALHAIERHRNGGSVAVNLAVSWQVAMLWPQQQQRHAEAMLRGAPTRNTIPLSLTYDRDSWVHMIDGTGYGEHVAVEIALPQNTAPPWDTILKAARTARDALKSGGESAWKAAIVECRHAIEEWNKLERPDHGLGWHSPSMAERMARTKAQRMDNLRWDLYQLAHEAAHSPADRFTRDDAILVLGTLSALLAIRNP